MRQLGTIVNFSPKGSIIIRSEITPIIGQVVCDNRGVPLGRVIRITGPVDRPYIMISPMAKDNVHLFRMGGRQVFLDERSKPLNRKERMEKPEVQRQRSGRDGGGRPRDRSKGSRSFKVRGKGEGGYKKDARRSGPSSRDRRKKTRK
ncbi:MAG: H/ACA ribonucleoprotein complex subunit GAR1 [Thermoplasmatota archaeon]